MHEKSLRWFGLFAVSALIFFGALILFLGLYSWIDGAAIIKGADMAAQGDFFGGHFAASASLLTLAAIVLFWFFDRIEQRRFANRTHFLEGAKFISDHLSSAESETAVQTDTAGKDLNVAFRAFEYYSRLAFELNDDELFLILNVVLANQLRKKIETEDKTMAGNYPFSIEASKRISHILSADGKKRRELRANKPVLRS